MKSKTYAHFKQTYDKAVAEMSDSDNPLDWDGTLENWPHAQMFGFTVDYVVLGHGNVFPIYSYNCISVPGQVPTICPNADRKPQDEWLPQIERRFRDLNRVKDDETIHWVGSQAKVGHVCGCFHPAVD